MIYSLKPHSSASVINALLVSNWNFVLDMMTRKRGERIKVLLKEMWNDPHFSNVENIFSSIGLLSMAITCDPWNFIQSRSVHSTMLQLCHSDYKNV